MPSAFDSIDSKKKEILIPNGNWKKYKHFSRIKSKNDEKPRTTNKFRFQYTLHVNGRSFVYSLSIAEKEPAY